MTTIRQKVRTDMTDARLGCDDWNRLPARRGYPNQTAHTLRVEDDAVAVPTPSSARTGVRKHLWPFAAKIQPQQASGREKSDRTTVRRPERNAAAFCAWKWPRRRSGQRTEP